VSSSLDLGLYLCRKWAGDDADIMIRYKMDYRG
jgi:cyclohexyl-isocyanide hydratase